MHTYGRGGFGRLGHGSTETIRSPRVVEALQVGQLGVEGKLVLGLLARRRRVAELDADVVATREKGDVLVPAGGEQSASAGGDPEDLEEQPAVQIRSCRQPCTFYSLITLTNGGQPRRLRRGLVPTGPRV